MAKRNDNGFAHPEKGETLKNHHESSYRSKPVYRAHPEHWDRLIRQAQTAPPSIQDKIISSIDRQQAINTVLNARVSGIAQSSLYLNVLPPEDGENNPCITLQGEWLRNIGFFSHQPITINLMQECIVISVDHHSGKD